MCFKSINENNSIEIVKAAVVIHDLFCSSENEWLTFQEHLKLLIKVVIKASGDSPKTIMERSYPEIKDKIIKLTNNFEAPSESEMMQLDPIVRTLFPSS